jgi:hypothetical protein
LQSIRHNQDHASLAAGAKFQLHSKKHQPNTPCGMNAGS